MQSKLNATTGSTTTSDFVLLAKAIQSINNGATVSVATTGDLPQASANTGRVFYITGDNTLRYSNGTSWTALPGNSAGIINLLGYTPENAANKNTTGGYAAIDGNGKLVVPAAGGLLAGSTSGNTTLIATAVASGTLTLPAATDTLVGRATTDTLTNKTLTAATLGGTTTYDILSGTGNIFLGSGASALLNNGTAVTTTLNGGINNTVTTITVASTSSFTSRGFANIDSETIYYTGKTATTLTGCKRGAKGTTAASHNTAATVTQQPYYGLTNTIGVHTKTVDNFTQLAIKNTNTGTSASTDFIAYSDDGDNNSGWIDLGITSSTYSDPAFTVTGPGTGYLFFSAPGTTTGTGDLLIGTDHTGSNNDIVFFTNGFDAGKERLRIIGTGANAGVAIYADTTSTSTTTGALRVNGGIGLQGNLNVGGNVSIVGTISVGGAGSSVSTTTLTVSDPTIRMASGNSADLIDIGFVGTYVSSGTKYTGLLRDATDSKYKLFGSITTNPTTTADFTGATYATLVAGALELTTALAVSSGGTGAATFAANSLLVGNATGSFNTIAPSTAGNILVSNGTNWVSTTPTFATTGKAIAMAMVFG